MHGSGLTIPPQLIALILAVTALLAVLAVHARLS
jgi:hypothetical protein